MNYITNDRGETVIACGSPGSQVRAQCQYPQLIEELDQLYTTEYEAQGKRVDLAIELIRRRGIKSNLETVSVLKCSRYGIESNGTVTALVLAI